MTRRFVVAGDPISQSRSPLIHGHWIAERGLDARYDRRLTPLGDLPALIALVREGALDGANLTIPLKEAAVPLLDELTPDAAAMGAVNTLIRRDGRVLGANTDVPGFFAHLDASAPGWDRSRPQVLLIGAGGAARAILHGLSHRPVARLILANRSRDRAQALAAQQPSAIPVEVVDWPLDPAVLADADVIINATALGMAGQPPLALPWPDDLSGKIAYDIVYVPLETPFLAQARARGAHPVDGLGMLLHQAAIAFGYWFGDRPAVERALRDRIAADVMAKITA